MGNKWPLTIAAAAHGGCTHHWQMVQPMCSHLLLKKKELPFAYKRGICWELNVRVENNVSVWKSEEKEKRKGCCHGQQPCSCKGSRDVSWVMSSSMYYCNPFSTSNNIVSPVDVGGFAEPRKILCLSVLTPPLSRDQYITGRRIPPNNWYQSTWFKVVFDFCSKMKVVKMVFWPSHCVEEDETKPLVKTTSNSNVEHGRTLHHSPARRLPTRTDASHASSSPGWVDPTRIPVDPTHYE